MNINKLITSFTRDHTYQLDSFAPDVLIQRLLMKDPTLPDSALRFVFWDSSISLTVSPLLVLVAYLNPVTIASLISMQRSGQADCPVNR